jgi:hypothetical protein
MEYVGGVLILVIALFVLVTVAKSVRTVPQ